MFNTTNAWDKQYEEYTKLSRCLSIIDDILSKTKEEITKLANEEEIAETVIKILKKHLPTLLNQVKEETKKHLDLNTLIELNSFLKTELGQKLIKCQAASAFNISQIAGKWLMGLQAEIEEAGTQWKKNH